MASTNGTDLSEIPITDRLTLKNKAFLITGGGRGIGFACAKAIAQLGGSVAVIDTLPQPTDEFNTLSTRYGVKTFYTNGDVTDQESHEAAFSRCVDAMGQLHGGLTAAGICVDEPLLDLNWDNCQRTLNVNVMGTLWTIKLLAKHMVEQKIAGSIVTIASINAQGLYVPTQPQASYNASKAAVKGMMGPVAGELGQYGIRINSISPGAIQTPLLKRLEASPEKRAILSFYRDGAPLGRLGLPEDLTPMVCYLLSEAAAFTTGADIPMTGGIHAGSVFRA